MKNGLSSDYSATGNGILEKRITTLFAEKFPESKIWMPDVYQWPSSGEKTVDVIYFGDFFRKFLESGNWTFSSARFWCLGSPAQNFFMNMLGFSEKEISVIPRELIYPFHSDGRKEFRDLIYAGRLSPSKRILTTIWAAYFLQKKGMNVRLKLFGNFIQEEKFCDCPGENPYETHVKKLMRELDWAIAPELQGNISPEEWPKNHESPAYISMSVLPFEDFSVSIAQAQEQRWPVIVSGWGAHHDLSGEVLKFPVQLFTSLYETEDSAKRDGEMVCDYVLKKGIQTVPKVQTELTAPVTVELSKIDFARREFLRKWGMNLQDVIRHRTDDLRQQENWSRFMKEYVKCFIL